MSIGALIWIAPSITWPRCRSGRRTQVCQQLSVRYECLPRRALILIEMHQQLSKRQLLLIASFNNLPTVIGLIFTPSSICAVVGSSESLCWRTFLPQRVFTNVVRPG